MLKRLILLGLLAATSAVPNSRQERGLMDDLLGSINQGFSQFGQSARQDLARLRPLAERMEERMKPAITDLHHSLHGAIGSLHQRLASSPLFGFANADRRDGEPIVTQDHHPVQDTAENPTRDQYHASIDQLFSQAMDPFRLFGLGGRRRNWWEGDNVCVDRQVIEEDEDESSQQSPGFMHFDMTSTSCREGESFRECTTKVSNNGQRKTVVVKHKCCYGYERTPGANCEKVDMQPLEDTMVALGAEEFVELLDTVSMKPMLEEAKDMTLFVPTDEAIEDFRHDLEMLNKVEESEEHVSYNIDDGLSPKRRRKRSELVIVEAPQLDEILKGHMVDGMMDTSEMHDEDVVQTLSDSKLRVTVYNTYPEKVVMANCAKMVSKDHYATNGVVHLVDRVLVPATQTLGEIIAEDPELSSLSAVLTKSGLMDKLNEPGQITFFAPNDKAFEFLDDKTRQKLEAGNGCSHDILSYHLLPNVICSGVIESHAKTINDLKKYVSLSRNEQDELLIEGKKVVTRDIVGTNGVLHIIDEVIVPESARSLIEALEEGGSVMLAELFEMAGLSADVFSNATLFAPSEKALKEMPKEMLESIKNDPERLQEFLLYHVATPKTCKCDMDDGKLLQSGIEGKKLRINSYNSMSASLLDLPTRTSTVQCAKITRLDDEACGGLIHTVEKVLLPPGGQILELLKDHGQYGTFLELVAKAGLEEELNKEGPFTLLAPTDDAFDHLKEAEKEAVYADAESAALTVRHHILGDMVCCAGIPHKLPFFDLLGRRTLAGDVVSLQRSHGGHIYAERSEVTSCDMVADNGVIHSVDRVLVPAALLGDSDEVAERKSDSPMFIFKLFK